MRRKTNRRELRISTGVRLAIRPLVESGAITKDEADSYVARYLMKPRDEQLAALQTLQAAGSRVDAVLEEDSPEWTI